MTITNPWVLMLLIAILIFLILIYLGIGFVTYLATVSDDEVHWKFKGRAKFILGWPYYAIKVIIKGLPKTN